MKLSEAKVGTVLQRTDSEGRLQRVLVSRHDEDGTWYRRHGPDVIEGGDMPRHRDLGLTDWEPAPMEDVIGEPGDDYE